MVLFSSCKAQLYYKSGTFKVEDAVKTTQYPGVMGSPINTTVSFKLILKNCVRIQFDSFWMDGFTDAVSIRYANGGVWDGKPLKGDTLLMTLSYYKPTSQEGMPRELTVAGSNEAAAPVAHKGGALFRYTLSGKKYYFSIKDIKQGESVYAP
ncbi:MAG: hypothetical protein IT244_07480 [Bacteroidia bacterium]|nr:hypothetical protein [Bacteroidia bacterium]